MEKLSNRPSSNSAQLTEASRYNKADITAKWCLPMNGKVYRVELEHGTTSGRRMIWVNGKEVLRRDWMFKLVGEDIFYIEKTPCIVRVDPAPAFKYDYLLFIDGKSYDEYIAQQAKAFRLWIVKLLGIEYRVVLELDTLNLLVNDQLRPEMAKFVDGGTDTQFIENGHTFLLQARSSGNKRDGIRHTLFVDGQSVPETKLHEIMQEPSSIST